MKTRCSNIKSNLTTKATPLKQNSFEEKELLCQTTNVFIHDTPPTPVSKLQARTRV